MLRMRCAFAVLMLCGILPGQTERPPVDWDKIQSALEVVRAAVEARDLDKASRAATDLWLLTVKERSAQMGTPAQRLRDMEPKYGAIPAIFPGLAKTAFEAGDMAKAEGYARKALASERGEAIHDGNMVLGRIALKNGDVEAAKAYLLAAGKTKGSVIFNNFGPNMSLAKDLLEKGERAVVLEYFDLCRAFWKGTNAYLLDDWTAMVKGGRMPDLRRNLVN